MLLDEFRLRAPMRRSGGQLVLATTCDGRGGRLQPAPGTDVGPRPRNREAVPANQPPPLPTSTSSSYPRGGQVLGPFSEGSAGLVRCR